MKAPYLFLLCCIGLVISLSGVLEVGVSPVAAQRFGQWTPQQRIPDYADDSDTPILIADQNRTVHAFNSQPSGSQLAIFYRTWTLEGGWSDPIDILLPPFKEQARLEDVILDQDGVFHLVFFSGDALQANIYYSKASSADAYRASAWSKPIPIGQDAKTPNEAAITGDNNGRVFVIYAGDVSRQGVYAVRSSDGGNTWTDPNPIFLTYSDDLWPTRLVLYTDSQDRVHGLWGVGNTTGNSEAIHYIALEPGAKEWSEPFLFAEAIDFEADTPNLIEYEGKLIVVYHNDLPTTRWMRRSYDHGKTWTAPVRLFQHVGTNGAASFAIDSNNTLHMFFGNRIGNPPLHAMWHSILENDRWSLPESITPAQPSSPDYDPSFAKAVVSQGNTILVSWTTDPAGGVNGAWYSYTTLDAPELPAQVTPTVPALPAPVPVSTPTDEIVISETAIVTPTPLSLNSGGVEDESVTESFLENPASALIAGSVLAFVLILVIFSVKSLIRFR